MARKAIYVSEERHRAIKQGALANGLTMEAYVEKLLQSVHLKWRTPDCAPHGKAK